jgi:hypothetical protein
MKHPVQAPILESAVPEPASLARHERHVSLSSGSGFTVPVRSVCLGHVGNGTQSAAAHR